MEKEKLNELSSLEMMYPEQNTKKETNHSTGLKTKNSKKENRYTSRFEIKGFITQETSTDHILPAVFDAIGNNFIKIGIAISSITAAIGYIVEKIKN